MEGEHGEHCFSDAVFQQKTQCIRFLIAFHNIVDLCAELLACVNEDLGCTGRAGSAERDLIGNSFSLASFLTFEPSFRKHLPETRKIFVLPFSMT